jgi:Ni,Fe-hydrogenase III large subunit
LKVNRLALSQDNRIPKVSEALGAGARLGFITSIDGQQLITALIWPQTGQVECFETPIETDAYTSLSRRIPQAHWFERTIWDMFGLQPKGHPRLKHTHLHEPYKQMSPPLSKTVRPAGERSYQFLQVKGDGVYEIPVGPIHAGIIEPGHFRLSCYGEVIANLEIRLGYVHRGVEKRLTEVAWTKTRFVAEAAASDMAVANALANATAIESLFEIDIPRRALVLRTIAAEIERVAMHISDLTGFATDVGFLGIASAFSRLRGTALGAGELLSGNRFMRGFICPGGTTRNIEKERLSQIAQSVRQLKFKLKPVIAMYLNNQVAIDRMDGTGRISPRLALDFGLVGVAARACGITYDCRLFSHYATFPQSEFPVSIESSGDVLARALVRISELYSSLELVLQCLQELESSSADVVRVPLPEKLPADQTAISIVESHRGELIHFIVTDEAGKITRYHIKDPSINNWTALAIAVRNHVVADFPLCNKSFSLSYSGHDM